MKTNTKNIDITTILLIEVFAKIDKFFWLRNELNCYGYFNEMYYIILRNII